MKTSLFLQARHCKKSFCFTLYTQAIPRAMFCLIWTMPWSDKNIYFQNSLFSKIQNFCMKTSLFLQARHCKKSFCFTLYTQAIPRAMFCLIWTMPWSDKNIYFQNSLFSKIQNFCMKTSLFPRSSYCKKSFRFTLYIQNVYSFPCFVWFGQFLGQMKNFYFQKMLFSKIQNFCGKTYLFP